MEAIIFLFVPIFNFLRKISNFLKRKYFIFSGAGIIFIIFIVVISLFAALSQYTNIELFKIIGMIIFSILVLYIICLIPFSDNKFKQMLKIVSYKSYFSFIFFFGIILWGILFFLVHFYFKNLIELFTYNSLNIMITLYAILTVIWFAYHIINSNQINFLKKQLSLYLFFITSVQLFFINKFSNFEYCISILILTFVFIQYLFDDKSNEENSNVA